MKYRQGEMHNRAKIPEKLATTVCFIENESSCCRQISKGFKEETWARGCFSSMHSFLCLGNFT